MFSTVPMSRMTLAAPVDAVADIVRACSDLGCVHIEDYTQFEEGIGVGHAITGEDADKVSALLVKVRAVRSNISVFNAKGAVSASAAKSVAEKLEAEIDKALGYIEAIREAESDTTNLEDQVRIFEKLAPLNFSQDIRASRSMLPKQQTPRKPRKSSQISETISSSWRLQGWSLWLVPQTRRLKSKWHSQN